MMYVEEIGDGPRFLAAAHEITHGSNPKPILVIKSGRTAEGAAAAASHTGSLAGSDELYNALMTQAGAFRVETVAELFDLAEVFTDPQLPAGRRTAIVTNAGGPGIMATDAAIRNGLELAKFRDYTKKSLQFQMPTVGSIKNPVDVIGDARSDRYRAALDAVTADETVDQVLVIVTPQTMTDVVEIAGGDRRDQGILQQTDGGLPDGPGGRLGGRRDPAEEVPRADLRLSGERHAGAGRQEPVRRVGAVQDPRLPGVSRRPGGGGEAVRRGIRRRAAAS